MAARKRPKKKAVEVVQAVPLKHRFPEDDDPSPYHDGRDPDAADEDSDDEEEPTWTEYKETFYEVVVQYPMEQHRNAQQLRALDEKLLDDVSALRGECEMYARSARDGRRNEVVTVRANATERVQGRKRKRSNDLASRMAPYRWPNDPAVTDEQPPFRDSAALPPTATTPLLQLDLPSSGMPAADTLGWRNGNADASSARSTPFEPSVLRPPIVPPSPAEKLPAALRHPSFAAILALRRQNPITASEKVSLATDAYDKTDRHIRTLDTKLEAHTLAGRHVPLLVNASGGEGGEETIELGDDDDEGSVLEVQARPARSRKGANSNGKKRSQKESAVGEQAAGVEDDGDVTAGLTGTAKVRAALSAPGVLLLEGEPNYCFCNLPSWGKMLGCDNNDCEREWFHPDCLGISQSDIPTGEWYCPECRPLFKNNGQRAKKRHLI